MEKKAQSAIEFLIVVVVALTIITGFLLAVQYNVRDENREKKDRLVLEIALNIQSELNFAQESSDGYHREFTIPLKVLGSEYEVLTGEGVVSVRTKNFEHGFTLSIPPTMGNILIGVNEIRRENGKVCANVPLEECFACGNGVIDFDDFGENCDGNLLRHSPPTCDTPPGFPYDHGPLICNYDCQYDQSFCSNCGDGKLQGIEECDIGMPLDNNNGDGCQDDCTIEPTYVCVTCLFQGMSDCTEDARAQCDNDIDDDCDGEKDLADFGCINDADDDEVNNDPTYQCSNGLDDDLDGKIDQDDAECGSYIDPSEAS